MVRRGQEDGVMTLRRPVNPAPGPPYKGRYPACDCGRMAATGPTAVGCAAAYAGPLPANSRPQPPYPAILPQLEVP